MGEGGRERSFSLKKRMKDRKESPSHLEDRLGEIRWPPKDKYCRILPM